MSGSFSQRLHLEMLSDKPRTETYRQVILSNSATLRGKVVMDLGCGTGVISLFCALLAQPAAVRQTKYLQNALQSLSLVVVLKYISMSISYNFHLIH